MRTASRASYATQTQRRSSRFHAKTATDAKA
jgi:hypothetical protein